MINLSTLKADNALQPNNGARFLCIDNQSVNPYFNLAAEEFLLKNFSDNIFMLWRNEPSIIVGKYQNTLAEINTDFVRKNCIKVVRRLTGGGAVFHDLGNLNFTFIENGSSGNFQTFTEPILETLQQLGVPAKFEGRNDLTINGQKISGNAQCIHNGRMLHHGTLLFSAQITNLSAALRVNPMKFEDKAVKSISKRVTNISEHLRTPLSVLQFKDVIMQQVMSTRKACISYVFSEKDISEIEKLAREKYSTWAWNFGESPKYSFEKMARTSGGNVEIHLKIDGGKIYAAKIYGDFFSRRNIWELENLLIGKNHNSEEMAQLLAKINIDDYICGAKRDDFLNLLF